MDRWGLALLALAGCVGARPPPSLPSRSSGARCDDSHASAQVAVLGEVRRPALVPAPAAHTIGAALATAGGLTPFAYRLLLQRSWGSTTRRWALPGRPSTLTAEALREPLCPGDVLLIEASD